ncbi:toll-like receptor 7 [Leptinotarsa decemlineata]|uniref:toll-like receptor 7 n=1 Tax=Leptinotarsa decemlineata TaxID=7539 RepID=UPI003D30A263
MRGFEQLSDIKNIRINWNGLKIIKEGFLDSFPNVKMISLDQNHLKIRRVFSTCIKLEVLTIRTNRIMDIESNAFDNMTNLRELDLGFNNSESIPDSINNLKSLTTLTLHYNRLKSISPYFFSSLNKLQIFDLLGNQLRTITPNTFNGLQSLEDLNLENNILTNLDLQTVLSDLKSLKTIKLSNNSFTCEDLKYFIEVMKSKGINSFGLRCKNNENKL